MFTLCFTVIGVIFYSTLGMFVPLLWIVLIFSLWAVK